MILILNLFEIMIKTVNKHKLEFKQQNETKIEVFGKHSKGENLMNIFSNYIVFNFNKIFIKWKSIKCLI